MLIYTKMLAFTTIFTLPLYTKVFMISYIKYSSAKNVSPFVTTRMFLNCIAYLAGGREKGGNNFCIQEFTLTN